MEKERKGISQITGKTEIKLGEKVFYKVSRIHRKEDHDKVKNALWKIYVKENGSWRELKSDPSVPQKKGDEVSYTITNQALAGKELLVEAYIYEPEKMAPPGLKIKVVAGTEKKIQRVELFMVDDTPIKEDTILKYNQTIKVKVYTLNMPNELLKLTLYEDDADKGGHNPKNEKNKVAFTDKQTNNNGFLWHEFKLNAEFSKIANAMMDGSSDKLHEYYVLVESVKYGNKTSENVEVENPEYVVHQTYENGKVIDHKNDKIYEGGVIEEVIIKGKYKKQMGIDPISKTGRSVSIVQEPPEKKEEKDKCFCNRDFEEKDVRKFVKLLKGSEIIWEGQALKGGKRAECYINDKSFASLTTALNNSLKKYNINHCSQKMHFLAQVCEETGTFSLSEETKSDFISSQSIYKGRGILQLTGVKIDLNDIKSRYDKPGPYQDYADYKGDQNIVKKPEIVASNIQYAIDSGAWIWSVNKKMTNNPKSEAIIKWGEETLGKSLNELAIYADKFLELISVLLNGRNKNTGMPNGWATRQMNYNLLKTGFFMYEKYHENSKDKKGEGIGIVSYHIYSGGKIEKHIPKEIKKEYRTKYKYIYHDKNDKVHELGTFNFTLTKEMNKGNVAGKNNVELIDIREFKGYSSNGVKLKFLTLNTSSKRYYINPDCYAGLLGAMADMNIDYLGFNGFSNFEAKSTGGSSSHRNGEKGDLRYLSKNKKGEATILQDAHFDVPNQHKFNDALYNFGWGRLEKMYSEYFNYNGNKNYLLNHTKHMRKDGPKGYRHYHHLHLSGFDHSLIKIIKE